MNSKLRTAGKVAAAATVVAPAIRKLMSNDDFFAALKDFRTSARHVRRARRTGLVVGFASGGVLGFAAGVLLGPRVRRAKQLADLVEQTSTRVAETMREAQARLMTGVRHVREGEDDQRPSGPAIAERAE